MKNLKLLLILLISVQVLSAQRKLSLTVAQDLKFATVGDKERGYDAFRPNFLIRLNAEGNQNDLGYFYVFPEFEYAKLDTDYYRYSFNVGYSFNRLIDNFEFKPTFGYGVIDRWGASVFSFGGSVVVSYQITKKLALIALNQLTERKDLKLMWNDNKIGYSFFLGVQVDL